MEEDLSLSLELGGSYTKRKREEFSEEEKLDNHEVGNKTETEKKLREALIMNNSLPSVLSEMKNKRTESFEDQFSQSKEQENNKATRVLSATSQHSTTSSQQEKQSIANKTKENQANIADTHDITISDIATMNEEENNHARKKLRLSKEQAFLLEENFRKHATLNPKLKVTLAKQLSLQPRQVEVWYQNRRARTKLKQTEIDCNYLKHRYQMLSQENFQLKREVAQLRAFSGAYANAAYPFYKHMPVTGGKPLCPSCVHSPTVFGNTTSGPADRNPVVHASLLSKPWF